MDNLKCLNMYTLRYNHSSSSQSYVRIKLCCDPKASCVKKKKKKRKKTQFNHWDCAPSQESFSSSTCVSLPGPNSHLYDTKTVVTWIKRSEYRHSVNTPRGKHSIDILISSRMQSVILLDCFFLLGHSLSNTVFFYEFFLLHAFLSDCWSLWSLFWNCSSFNFVFRLLLVLSCIFSM